MRSIPCARAQPYKEWKQSHQSKASEEQLRRMEETKSLHAKHAPPPDVPVAAPSQTKTATRPATTTTAAPAAPGGLSDVCCVPEEELAAIAAAATDGTACPAAPLAIPQPDATIEIHLGVLTVSDRAHQGTYQDLSGPEVQRSMQAFAESAYGARWRLATARTAIVPDEQPSIVQKLTEWSSAAQDGTQAPCTLILTTGGTGLAPRDVTPEATASVIERATPGIVELIQQAAMRHEPLAALSRATAGVRGRTLIVNLPGRPKAVRENVRVLAPLLAHALLEVGASGGAASAAPQHPKPPDRYVSFNKLDKALQ
jgi:molybdopterin adenylyltransferase